MNIQFEKITDRQLVNRVIANDPDAINYLFDHQCSRILACISAQLFDGLIGVAELSQEWKSEIEKQNWQKLRHFKYESSLYSWLCIMATRYFLKKKNNLGIIGPETIPVKADVSVSFIINGAVQNLNRVQIMDALLKLQSPQERLILLWYILDGMNIHEIAYKSNLIPNTVEEIKTQALENLFHRFKELNYV